MKVTKVWEAVSAFKLLTLRGITIVVIDIREW